MLRKLKRLLIVLLLLFIAFWSYVLIVNRNSKHMTTRQKILKAVYPAWMWWAKVTGKNTTQADNAKKQAPAVSFYLLQATDNKGVEMPFAAFKGKKVLLVNTASDCGYTKQYEELEALYQQHRDKLVVLAFPANDFHNQEKGTDDEIAQFCKLNYGVDFPVVKKAVVVKQAGQHPVFQWLTDSAKNGWNNRQPVWNFTKYLVNEEGVLTNYFGPTVSPLSKEVEAAVKM